MKHHNTDQEIIERVDFALAKVREVCFKEGYEPPVAEVLGVAVAKSTGFDGVLIVETCIAALEDANFRDLSERITEALEDYLDEVED